MSNVDLRSPSFSEVTLTPGTDDASDYHRYLEKTSQKDTSSRMRARGESSVTGPPAPRESTDIHHSDPSRNSSPPVGSVQGKVKARPTSSTKEKVGLALPKCHRKKRPHRVESAEDPHEYPGPLPLSLLTVGICLSVFLVSLDRTIVATVDNLFSQISKAPTLLTNSI